MPKPSQLPSVVIVGRPNVGKSTLFNRLTGTRRAIVGDEPGMTRDRIYGRAHWRGRSFGVVDTGGLLPDSDEAIPEAILRQARIAIEQASVLLFVIDGRSELAAPDLQLAPLLLRTGKPVLLLVNKIEGAHPEAQIAPFHRLGLEPLYPISAEHGTGLDVVLDRILGLLPATTAAEAGPAPESPVAEPPPEIRVAIVGRPNVGKSTLLNRLTGEQRAIVSEIAGTTRDAVDALVERDGELYRFIDTAGIRRKGVTREMADKLSVIMARKHLEQAELALVLLDGAEEAEGGVLTLDATIAGYAVEALRSIIVVVNKWDRARALGRTQADLSARIRQRLKFLAFAPIVFISAQEGLGLGRLYAALQRVARERGKRVPTAALNRFLATVDLSRAPVPSAQRIKIYYLSQVATSPPQFVLFTDHARPLHFSYRRFLENRLREAFGFSGSPILLRTRASRGGRR